MLACIPTNTGAGIDDSLCDHFGSAAYFTLYDSDTDRVTVVANGNAHHSHGTCHPMNVLSAYPIDAVICRGMGRRAVEMMNAEGITIYRARVDRVSHAIDLLKAGTLRELSPKQACAGHSGRHTFSPGAGGERGRGRGEGMGRGGAGGRGQGRGTGR